VQRSCDTRLVGTGRSRPPRRPSDGVRYTRTMDRAARALAYAAAAGLGTFAPTSESLLACAALVGLIALREALHVARNSAPLALLVGLTYGLTANAFALASMGPLLERHAGFSWYGARGLTVALCALQALPFAAAAVATQRVERRQRGLAFPLAFCALPALVPQVFPWQLGATQLGFLPFVQVAELGGAAAVSLLLLLTADALHRALRGPKRPRALIIALSSALLPCSYGALRIAQVEGLRTRAPTLRVGVVQSGLGIDHPRDGAGTRAALATLTELTRKLEQHGAELTVWGESAYPFPLRRSAMRIPDDERSPLRGAGGPLLMGLETVTSFADDAARFNSAWLVHPTGALGDRVDKARLIPFAESVPLYGTSAWLRDHFGSHGLQPGSGGTVTWKHARLGVLICYEDLFPASARASVQNGGAALVNLTNDAWFGPSAEPRLHDLAARLRAIEQRRDLVRAVNTGVSSFTSASGRLFARTESSRAESFVAELRLLQDRTLYSRTGDVLPYLGLLAYAWLTYRARRAGHP
jgi:apolipoprotein N-acyltransferase